MVQCLAVAGASVGRRISRAVDRNHIPAADGICPASLLCIHTKNVIGSLADQLGYRTYFAAAHGGRTYGTTFSGSRPVKSPFSLASHSRDPVPSGNFCLRQFSSACDCGSDHGFVWLVLV